METAKMPYLIIRSLDGHKEVYRVQVTSLNERHVEKTMLSMLRNMDTKNYFIDDSEVDDARREKRDKDTQEFDTDEFLANHRSSRLIRRQFASRPPRLDKDETSADRRLQ